MQPKAPSDNSGYVCVLVVALVCAFIVGGCVSSRSRRQRDVAKLFTVVPGQERDDFARLVSWIADHDGHITLPVGGEIHWWETPIYRGYSNDVFVIATTPPRFHETRFEIRWVAGTVNVPEQQVAYALYGSYGARGPNTYDFAGVEMRPWGAPHDGMFGVRFGYSRPRLLQVLEWHIAVKNEDNQNRARRLNNNDAEDRIHIYGPRGFPNLQQTSLDVFLTSDREAGYMKVRMPYSPGLSMHDFYVKGAPPVIRRGSFIVDVELAAKGAEKGKSPIGLSPIGP